MIQRTKVCISGAKAPVSFPFWDFTSMLSPAVKYRNMCGMSLPRKVPMSLGGQHRHLLLCIQPWQQKLRTPIITPGTHHQFDVCARQPDKLV